ncbi:uncharacterized protein LOC110846390 isoform X1 [Folsomia candida]|uniref:uncharacterized protein LOC110846390 isoform X1 n=1 Tax=Folsomia candida TaxID=158441 RepID=UPI000B9059B5|nr:uncharacterized protein LOC110846390 isoform X1 [Folsomia candida]XP_035705975.1 uncharacterized protein LOC110846390 isoform X1 [Folsomia candida]
MLLRSRRINNAVNSSFSPSPPPPRANKKNTKNVLLKKSISKSTAQNQPTKIVRNLRSRKCSPLVNQTPTIVARTSKRPVITHNITKTTKTTPAPTPTPTPTPMATTSAKEHVNYSNSILMNPPSLENYNITIPLRSEHYDIFSNFFSTCVQCDEEFLCHIKLKFLLGNPSATSDTLSQELSDNISKECINYVRLRVSEGNCDHGQGDAGPSSMESGFLESLVKVEISENNEFVGIPNDASAEVKSEPISDPQQVNEEDDEQLLLPNPLFQCPNVPPSASEPCEEVEDVQIIGIGRAVGMVMTFKFNNSSSPMPSYPESRSDPPAKQVSNSSSRIIIRRPGRRQLPPQPRYVPQVINGVNVAAFQSKLNNLRMCGICNYPANGMVDLNTHQRIAHSLYKGKVAGLPIAK